MSVQVSYKKQSLVGIIFLVIILAAVEGFLRIDDYYNNSCIFIQSNIYEGKISLHQQKLMCNDYRDIAYLGGVDRQIHPNQENQTIHINNFGMRGPDITQNKPSDTIRIFVVGGSTTYGSGSSSDGTTIPGYLQEFFDNTETSKKFQVINAGIEGSTSIEDFYRIKNVIIHLEPDIVILYQGNNDAHIKWHNYIVPEEEFRKTPLAKKILFFFQAYLPEYKTPINAFYLIDRITAEDPIGQGYYTPDDPYFNPEHMNERTTIWHNRMQDACNFGNENGFKTFVIIQPSLGTGNKSLTEYEESYLKSLGGDDGSGYGAENYNTFANGLIGLDNYCDSTHDLRYLFDDIEKLTFYDNVHLSDFGNKIVAKKMFEIINDELL